MLEEIHRTNRNMSYEYVEYVEYSPKNPHLDKKIIHIDSTLTEVDTYYPHTIEIAADIEDMIKAVLNELQQMKKENPSLLLAANAEHEGVDSIVIEELTNHLFIRTLSIHLHLHSNKPGFMIRNPLLTSKPSGQMSTTYNIIHRATKH
jgi:hypothetical protein